VNVAALPRQPPADGKIVPSRSIQVLDVAELVAASIPDVPVDRLVRKKSSS
jgi:hypothetical protein